MSNCCGGVCGSFGTQFDAARAEGDARQYRTKGPNATTRQLRDGVILAGAGQTLLDIGAGIGAASIELLAAGFATAFTVDASPAYVTVARREAQARGLAGRMTILEGDFLANAATVPAADAVVMDRVICCYPEYRPLLEEAPGVPPVTRGGAQARAASFRVLLPARPLVRAAGRRPRKLVAGGNRECVSGGGALHHGHGGAGPCAWVSSHQSYGHARVAR